MADRPILFSSSMVLALLREVQAPGTGKTQTRRIIKPQPTVRENGSWSWEGRHGGFVGSAGTHVNEGFPQSAVHWSRIQPGDRLWVREAWHAARCLDCTAPRDIPRDADIEHAATARSYAEIGLKGKLRPGMFMPRWASRITLYVTDVRVERLQDISEEDARAEGVEMAAGGGWRDYRFAHDAGPSKPDCIGSYRTLWRVINGPGAWDENPFVAAYSFRCIPKNIDALTGDE